MDAKVVARYYRLSEQPNSTDFHELLLEQVHLDISARERTLTDEYVVRVERCAWDGAFVQGEFCRIQTANLPPSAGPTGLTPIVLEEGHGIGHLAAFRYHPPTRVLLLQSNSASVNDKRILEYISALNAASVFASLPVLTKDAWDRFTKKPIRSMQISFASPANLEALDQAGVPAAKGAKALAEAYEGTSVEIIVGVGKKRKSFLNRLAVGATIEKVIGMAGGVTKARVQTATDDEDHEPAINFLKEHMKGRRTLTLPSDNPDSNYLIREAFLREELNGRLAYLVKVYEPNGNAG